MSDSSTTTKRTVGRACGVRVLAGLVCALGVFAWGTATFAQGCGGAGPCPTTDTDGDGAPDVCELAHGFDPTDPADGAFDPDFDGLDNSTECQVGKNPLAFNGPTAPGVHTPANEMVSTIHPALVVVNATDPDADELSYRFEVYADEAMTVPVTASAGVPAGLGTTAWEPELPMAEDRWYFWRSQASDGFAVSEWSQTGAFFVDVANITPMPRAVSPVGVVNELEVALEVMPVTDPEGDVVTYEFQVAESDSFANVVWTSYSASPVWRVPARLSEDVTYYWRARTHDDRGATSEFSTPVGFRADSFDGPPTVAWVTSPTPGQEVGVDVTVAFDEAFDPEGADVTYQVQVAFDPSFRVLTHEVEGLVERTWRLEGLDEDQSYWVRVRGWSEGSAGQWALTSFRVNTENNAPSAPQLWSPADGSRVGPGRLAVEFGASADPEGSRVAYTVRFFSDEATEDLVAQVEAERFGETWRGFYDVPEFYADSQTFFWTVQAFDPAGNASDEVGPWTVTVTPVPNAIVEAPQTLGPAAAGALQPGDDVVLVALGGADPDRDELTYSFFLFDDESLVEPVWTADVPATPAKTQVTVTDVEFPEGKMFYWYVFATDVHGARSAVSTTASFSVVAQSDPAPASDGGGCTISSISSNPSWVGLLVVALVGLITVVRRR